MKMRVGVGGEGENRALVASKSRVCCRGTVASDFWLVWTSMELGANRPPTLE